MGSIGCVEGFVALATQRLAAAVAFYSALLGGAPKTYIQEVYAEFRLPGLKLGIFQPKQDNQPEFAGTSSGAMSLCLEVQNLEAAVAHLTAAGYPPPGPVRMASHGREIYAYDPDGNRLILHQGAAAGDAAPPAETPAPPEC